MKDKNKQIIGPSCWCNGNVYDCLVENQSRGFKILSCRQCGTARTFPVPDFSKERYVGYPMESYKKNRKILLPFMQQILDLTLEFKKEGRLLEIGSGAGYFLELAQKRFEVFGLELSQAGIKLSRRNLGEDVVYRKTLEEASFPSGYFDVIMMNHVLEHILDLKNFFGEIRRVLKKDGVVVIGLPNFGGAFSKLRKAKWPGLQPKEHVWQFEPESLTRVLKACGFEVLKLERKAPHNFYSIFDFRNLSIRQFLLKIINWTFGLLGKGDNLLLVAGLKK